MFSISKHQVREYEFALITYESDIFKVTFMNYGASIHNIYMKNSEGVFESLLLSFNDLSSYIKNGAHLNATIGPVSGRIGNASFTINDETYVVDKNFLETENLHGGKDAYSHQFFTYEVNEETSEVIFTYHQKEEDSLFPGSVMTKVIYKVDNQTITINYQGLSNKDTILNLTNHAYFNLSGNLKETVLNHELMIPSSRTLELNDKFIPYMFKDSRNTHLDFRENKRIKDNFFEGIYHLPEKGIDNPLLLDKVGLNHKQVNYYDPISKRNLEIYTSYPCCVLYTDNHLSDHLMTNGLTHEKHMGICFEMQYEPNGINIDGANSAILKKQELYDETIIFAFSVKE